MSAIANPSQASPAGFYITVATPKGTTTKKIEGDTLTVGRASDCNLTIQHDTLSRRHMSVLLKNGECYVEDHGSSNGTFVNGKRIKPHSPVRVLPDDTVQLGQSGVKISASIEPQMWKGTSPSIPSGEGGTPPDTIVTSTRNERRLKAVDKASPDLRSPEQAQAEAEKMVQEAQKRAAAMIQEAEVEAERRVQDIYRRAHETQAKIDEVYQRRMNEAYRSAEKMYQKSQADSEVILDEARRKSAEIRAQAEGFVMELRARTEQDCERLLDEAQATARELKENRLLEAEEIIRKKEEEVVQAAREAMATRVARFEEDLVQEAERQRSALETELNERRRQLEEDSKDQVESIKKLKAEAKQLAAKCEAERSRLEELEATAARLDESRREVEQNETRLREIRTDIETLTAQREECKAALAKVKETQIEMDDVLKGLRAKFEENKAKLEREEQKHLEDMKLNTARSVRALEEQMLDELMQKKERLSREIGLSLESFLKENPKGSGLTQEVAKLIDAEIATMSADPTAKTKQASLVSLKRREKFKSVTFGILLGAILTVGGERAYRHVQTQQTPMKAKIAQAVEERRQDLEKRKFNPPQTPELKSTYVDAVLYTEKFTETYGSEEFQRKLLKEATPYLLKTWRVEEEKVIQLIAASATLVKALGERKDSIHPDFVNQGLEKMRELEADTLKRMREILGTQVRVESYRKFERKFYESFVKGEG